jgi:ferritin-like metal-binding protein YciE
MYTVLTETARLAGDSETQQVCEQILPQEIAMADWLKEHLPQITAAFLQRSANPDVQAKR